MQHDLTSSLGSDVVVGIAQAAGAIALCLGVVTLCRWFGVNVEREAASSSLRDCRRGRRAYYRNACHADAPGPDRHAGSGG
jgi:hypothetical protein